MQSVCIRVCVQSSTGGYQQNWCQPVSCYPSNCAITYYIIIYLVDLLLRLRRGFCCWCAHIFLVEILHMSNSRLTPQLAADTNSTVGDLTTPKTKDKLLPPLYKIFWEDRKKRKHTDGGCWGCIWCVFNTIADNHTKALSRVSKLKLLGVNFSLFVDMIP